MSTMERRLQILLDQQRFDTVSTEAQRTGKSVAAIIREAIDFRYPPQQTARMVAAADLLRMIPEASEPEPEWEQSKRDYEDWLERKLSAGQ